MAKDPAFLFYPGDYLRDTQCLSERAQVAYDRIMCEHMRNICISKQQLKFFTKRLEKEEFEELMMLLTEVDDGYQIEWVADSILKRRSYSESRRKNRKGKMKNISKTYDKHMENENENENEIKEENKKVGKDQNYKLFVQAYFDWFEDRFSISPQFSSKDGAAIKTIMKYLTSEVEKAGKDADIQTGALKGWQIILENWDNIPDDFIKTKMTKPNQIASNIDKILGYFKKPQKKSVTANAAEKMKDSLELFKQRKNANSKS